MDNTDYIWIKDLERRLQALEAPPQVKIKKLTPGATVPFYVHSDDSGMDLVSTEDHYFEVGARTIVGCGIAIELPKGYEAQVRPRSGLALKHGITVVNSPGTIDRGYTGEICAILINYGPKSYFVRKGDRVAQLVITKVAHAEVQEVQDLSETERGTGGFGSTGQ